MIRIEIKKINNYPYLGTRNYITLGMRNYITLVLFFNKDKGLCLNDINDFVASSFTLILLPGLSTASNRNITALILFNVFCASSIEFSVKFILSP